MKLTKSQLKQIIKEEIAEVLHEEWKPPAAQIADSETSCEDNAEMLRKLASSYSYSPDEMRRLADAYRRKCKGQTTDEETD